MDVNEVRFGNYSIGSSAAHARKKEEEHKEELSPKVQNGNGVKNFSADEVLGALDAHGLQNKAQINFIAKREIDPAKFLTEDRISDIEAMMAEFENGVGKVADVIEAEFPSILPQDQKMALAAKIYAQG